MEERIGIVTTWYERGAAYVSKQFEEVLQERYEVFIFARGEIYAEKNSKWDKDNVYWSKKIYSPLSYYIREKEFKNWVKENKITLVIFNEQRYWLPVFWCRELNVKTLAYVDYYTEETAPLFEMYDAIICNTKKHMKAISNFANAEYIPWGTDLDIYHPKTNDEHNKETVTFFHSAGMNPYRKGADILIEAFFNIHQKTNSNLIIHVQNDLSKYECMTRLNKKISILKEKNRINIINKTVSAPGLYTMGDVYVYPSRLDGLGLTVVEAVSSGLAVVVTDDAPMNEFVSKSFSRKINVDRFVSRKDGYYWPQAYCEISSLENILLELSNDKIQVNKMKKSARKYAEKNFDWKKNSKMLFDIINRTKLGDFKKKKILIEQAKLIDERKFPKINRLHFFYSFLYMIIKKFR